VPTGSTIIAFGTLGGVLDNLDQLLGLVDGVMVGVNNLDFYAEPGSRLCR